MRLLGRMGLMWLMGLMVVWATGCKDARLKQQEARMAELEQRVDQVVEVMGAQLAMVSGVIDGVTNWMTAQSNVVEKALLAGDHLQQQQQELIKRIEAAVAQEKTNKPRTVVQYLTAPAAQTGKATGAMRDGVPAAVYNRIAEEAARKWPESYNMQIYEIKQETDAYKKLYAR